MKYLMLLIVVYSSSIFAEEKYGDWVVDRSLPDIQIARVSNSNGEVTGVICTRGDDDCIAYYANDHLCSESSLSMALVNSPLGVFSTKLKCEKVSSSFVNTVIEHQNIMDAFNSGGPFAYAIALDDGYFKSSRFSSAGATRAISAAMTFKGGNTKKSKSDTSIF